MDINTITLVGRLESDVVFTPASSDISARAVGRLIVNRPPNKSGKRQNDAIKIVGWDKHAINLAKYTSKGKELGIVGTLRINSVAPTQVGGEWKNYTEVVITNISFGNDSSQAKTMKALQGGEVSLQSALSTLPGADSVKSASIINAAANLIKNKATKPLPEFISRADKQSAPLMVPDKGPFSE